MRSPLDMGKAIEETPAGGQVTPVWRRRWAVCAAVAALAVVAACGETITKHGHQFQENDLKSINSGMSQEQVKTTLGTPTTTATVGSGSAYYSISSTQGQSSSFKPVEKNRKVLAVYFNKLGSVDRAPHYGIKTARSSTTPTRRRPPRRGT